MKRFNMASLPPRWQDYTGNPLVQRSCVAGERPLSPPRDVSREVQGDLEVRVIVDDDGNSHIDPK